MRRLFEGRVRKTTAGGSWVVPAIAAPAADLPSFDGLVERIVGGLPESTLRVPMRRALADIVAGEAAALAVNGSTAGLGDGLAARRQARALTAFAANAAAAMASWEQDLRQLSAAIVGSVPACDTGGAVLRVEVALIDLVERPGELLTDIIGRVLSWVPDDPGALRLGRRLGDVVKNNLLSVSGLTHEEAAKKPLRIVWPHAAKGSGRELTAQYLDGTALATLLLAPVPFAIAERSLFEHTWMVAKSGHGKTQLIEWLVTALLARRDHPSIIVIDSQGELLQRIGRLACFAPGGMWHDRLVYIDAREMERPMALNPMAQHEGRKSSYTPVLREQMLNGSIELLEFLFGSVLGAELTQKQGVIFRYLIRLLMVIPGANITTLRDVLEEPERFAAEMQRLDGSARHFFDRQFFGREYAATRSQILRRLWGIFEQPTFERMLSSRDNKLDFFEATQSGRVILADTAMDFLKEERSRVLGRLIIAMTLQAIFERAAVPKHARRPTFLIIDEAHEVLDDNVGRLQVQARKFACGVFAGHQMLEQLPRGLRKALAMSSVKLVGKVTAGDADELAADMGTTAGMLLGLRKYDGRGSEFALSVSNRTSGAVRIEVPFGVLDRQPTMSEAEWAALRARINDRYGARPAPPVSAPRQARVGRRDDDDDGGWFS